MPIMEILPPTEDQIPIWTEAYMLFPGDESQRIQYFILKEIELIRNKAESRNEDVVKLPVAYVHELLSAPSSDDYEERIKLIAHKGSISGFMLTSLAVLKANGERPSLRKAAYLAGKWYEDRIGQGNETPLVKNLRNFIKYWHELMSVSHFWAANNLMQENSSSWKLKPNKPDLLIHSIAKQIASSAGEIVSSYRKNPEAIFSQTDLFHLPPQYHIDEFKFSPPLLSKEQLLSELQDFNSTYNVKWRKLVAKKNMKTPEK